MWPAVLRSNDPKIIRAFLEACPNSSQAELARVRLRRLQTTAPKPASNFPTQSDYRAAQTELRRLRLYDSGIDGDWGPRSKQAMAAFQRQVGLQPVSGELTASGLAALKAATLLDSPPSEAIDDLSVPIAENQSGQQISSSSIGEANHLRTVMTAPR